MKVKKKKKQGRPTIVVDVPKLHKVIEKSAAQTLSAEDRELLKVSIDAMAERLRPSRSNEKTSAVLDSSVEPKDGANATPSEPQAPDASRDDKPKPPRPGHGRHAASKAYTGATFIPVPHPELSPQFPCPCCKKGKVYRLKPPKILVRIVGLPPIMATVYHLDRLRCSLCEEIFTAPTPAGVGDEKYDASVASMVAVLKYGGGMPFYRIEQLQQQMGILLPSSTQWELVNEAANALQPVHTELTRLAAQGDVITYDDTGVRILGEVERPESHDEDRTGLHTTGFVVKVGDRQLALYVSGPNHAGENLTELLKLREADSSAVIAMADGLSHNEPKLPPGVELLPGNCLIHGRRHFVKVFDSFPNEVKHVMTQLGQVYLHDKQARDQQLTPEQRLAYHQEHSGPIMEALKTWMDTQLEVKQNESNSGLGKAIKYNTKRWERLTLFLRVAGAPLDSNTVERSLKTAVLHRKNSMFYKTQHGADVGDMYMSLIRTCALNDVNAFQYLTELQRHAAEVRASPAEWLPWNYHFRLPPAPD